MEINAQAIEIEKSNNEINSLNDRLDIKSSEIDRLIIELDDFSGKQEEQNEKQKNYFNYKTIEDLTVYQSKSETSNVLGVIPKNTILKFHKNISLNNNGQNRIRWWGITYDGLPGYFISEYWGLDENLQNGWRQNLLIVKQ